MKILSINVGRPRQKIWKDKSILTSIFKYPVNGPRKISYLNIEGDEQSDLSVHGGINKAVYAYDASHYEHWKNILPRDDWQCGMFGENLTTVGLVDDEVRIGNIYEIGTAKLEVTQPRFPCLKINIRFGLPDMVKRFAAERRSGIYFKVIEEGMITAGDSITLLETAADAITIRECAENYYSDHKG